MTAKKPSTKLPKVAFIPEKGTPYTQLMRNREAFAGYTAAAFVHAGYITLNEKSATKSRSKGDAEFLKEIIGGAFNNWKAKGRLDKNGTHLTVAGMNEVNARFAGQTKFNTTVETAKRIAAAMAKGGSFKVGEDTFKLPTKVELKAE